jgi:hypothetical protein
MSARIVAVVVPSGEQLCARCYRERQRLDHGLTFCHTLTEQQLEGLRDCSECGRDLVAVEITAPPGEGGAP